ncbi:MAG: amidase [Candidatus Binataceae bacterium]
MLDPYIEAWQLRELILRKEVRPREVAEFFLRRIEKLNPSLGAYITVTAERAMADAARLEKTDAAEAAAMPLFGVPYSIKDLTWTRNIRTTFGSRAFANFVPTVDAEVVTRCDRAGGILLGKTATPAFGSRSTTEGGFCPPARNPWDRERTAGGSSGGAGCQVAAGMGPLAEGTDGGGSIRIPAACCGVVGLKPSRGRISYAPVYGESWAGCATIGPLARSVRDAVLLLEVMAGPVMGDPYWIPPPKRRFSAALAVRPRGLRLGAISETVLSSIEPETAAAFDSACELFRELGHRVDPIEIDLSRLLESFQIVAVCSIAGYQVDNLELLDPDTRGIFEAARRTTAPEYIRAVSAMHNVARQIVQELAPYDAILAPTLTRPAVRLGTMPNPERPLVADLSGRNVPEVYTWLAFTYPFNATGQPAFSLPNGFTKTGLPIGLQIVGRRNDEFGIIALAAAFEEARPWKDQRPPIG